MRIYQIPNTDNNSHLTRTLKFNFLKYRTLLHFIYKNKSFYKIEGDEVHASDDFVVRECGSIVCKVANVKLCWKKVWSEISKDEDFLQHVKDMFETPDIVEFLSSIIPCGITRCMHEIVIFAESLKKCYDDLSKEASAADAPKNIEAEHKTLNKWLVEFDKEGQEVFTIPSEIYELAQRYAEEDSPNFTKVIDYIILNSKAHRLLRPYVWATVMEQFHDFDVELPAYEPHSALQYATLNSSMNRSQLDNSNREDQSTSKANEKNKPKPRGRKKKVVTATGEEEDENVNEEKQITLKKEKMKKKKKVVRRGSVNISSDESESKADKEEKLSSISEEFLELSYISENETTNKIKKIMKKIPERISVGKNEADKDRTQKGRDMIEIFDSVYESEESRKTNETRITRSTSMYISTEKGELKVHKEQGEIVDALVELIENIDDVEKSKATEKSESKDDNDLKGVENALDKWLNGKTEPEVSVIATSNKPKDDDIQDDLEDPLGMLISGDETEESEKAVETETVDYNNQQEVEDAVKALISSECDTEEEEKVEKDISKDDKQEMTKYASNEGISLDDQANKDKDGESVNLNDDVVQEVESTLDKVSDNKGEMSVVEKAQEIELGAEEDENQVENAIDEFFKELSGGGHDGESDEVVEKRVTRSTTGHISPVKEINNQPNAVEEEMETCEVVNEENREIIKARENIVIKNIFRAKKRTQKVKKDNKQKSKRMMKKPIQKEKPSCEMEQEQEECEEANVRVKDRYIVVENIPQIKLSVPFVPGMVVEDWEMKIRLNSFRYTAITSQQSSNIEDELRNRPTHEVNTCAPISRKRYGSRNDSDIEREPKKMRTCGIMDHASSES